MLDSWCFLNVGSSFVEQVDKKPHETETEEIIDKMNRNLEPLNTVILVPLCPVSLMHKKCQRHKIIHGMPPVGCKGRSIDLKMFL